ncbi:MAG: hypothetical protein Ta2G_16940 [Termitinemataceae bacterium]|nr:MAG: hypothetical protein Ta2G_16940 [Termitinemataceae bacterium]
MTKIKVKEAKIKKNFIRIKTFGVCVLVFSLSSFIRGIFKGEVVLQLVGAAFFLPLLYCFICTLFLGLLYKKKALSLSAAIIPSKVNAGENAYLSLNTHSLTAYDRIIRHKSKKYFFSMPAILIRYCLSCITKDQKKTEYIFEGNIFNSNGTSPFNVQRRGAYYDNGDTVLVTDIFGFFVFPLPVKNTKTLRLLAMPSVTVIPDIETQFSGGDTNHRENKIVKTDELLDQRVYIPGDDPRRINWKLFFTCK